MDAKRLFIFSVVMFIASACAVSQSGEVIRVGLLAPFEGRYRAVGYDALFAARLALNTQHSEQQIELLAVDDGGSVELATQRAAALAEDEQVRAVILLGREATAPQVQLALGDLPALVVGYSDSAPQSNNVFFLANIEYNDILATFTADADHQAIVGDESLALEQFVRLEDNLEGVTIVTSGNLPDETFAEAYVTSDPFAPQPGLLATLTYDVFGMVAEIIRQNPSLSRAELTHQIEMKTYAGLSGEISFESGYWIDAPVNIFRHDSNGRLLPVERVVK